MQRGGVGVAVRVVGRRGGGGVIVSGLWRRGYCREGGGDGDRRRSSRGGGGGGLYLQKIARLRQELCRKVVRGCGDDYDSRYGGKRTFLENVVMNHAFALSIPECVGRETEVYERTRREMELLREILLGGESVVGGGGEKGRGRVDHDPRYEYEHVKSLLEGYNMGSLRRVFGVLSSKVYGMSGDLCGEVVWDMEEGGKGGRGGGGEEKGGGEKGGGGGLELLPGRNALRSYMWGLVCVVERHQRGMTGGGRDVEDKGAVLGPQGGDVGDQVWLLKEMIRFVQLCGTVEQHGVALGEDLRVKRDEMLRCFGRSHEALLSLVEGEGWSIGEQLLLKSTVHHAGRLARLIHPGRCYGEAEEEQQGGGGEGRGVVVDRDYRRKETCVEERSVLMKEIVVYLGAKWETFQADADALERELTMVDEASARAFRKFQDHLFLMDRGELLNSLERLCVELCRDMMPNGRALQKAKQGDRLEHAAKGNVNERDVEDEMYLRRSQEILFLLRDMPLSKRAREIRPYHFGRVNEYLADMHLSGTGVKQDLEMALNSFILSSRPSSKLKSNWSVKKGLHRLKSQYLSAAAKDAEGAVLFRSLLLECLARIDSRNVHQMVGNLDDLIAVQQMLVKDYFDEEGLLEKSFGYEGKVDVSTRNDLYFLAFRMIQTMSINSAIQFPQLSRTIGFVYGMFEDSDSVDIQVRERNALVRQLCDKKMSDLRDTYTSMIERLIHHDPNVPL
eukprot:Nk52_evm5s168 gene=Nk52_evmTU5s168